MDRSLKPELLCMTLTHLGGQVLGQPNDSHARLRREHPLSIPCWNCNSYILSSLGTFLDVLSMQDLIFLTKTREIPKRSLRDITRYH